jgi:hypothetical protein
MFFIKILDDCEAELHLPLREPVLIYDSNGKVIELVQWFYSETKLPINEFSLALESQKEETCLNIISNVA